MSTMQQREMALSKHPPIERRMEFLRAQGFVDSVALTVWARRERSLYIRRTIKTGVSRLISRLTYRVPAAAIVLLAAIATVPAQQSEPAKVAALGTGAPATEAAAPQGPRIFSDVRFLLDDPTIRDQVSLAENAWDFTDANGMPGFGPLPDAQ